MRRFFPFYYSNWKKIPLFRLLFTPQGEWIGLPGDANPLQGWDVSAVRHAGSRHGLDPSGDILGCLFFHVKSELREFSSRIKEYNINVHLLQYDSRLLSKGISIGVLPAFSEAAFDRIDVGDMTDQMGVAECLADWGPLLNRKNSSSSLIMHSKRWYKESPNSIARNNPQALKNLTERCQAVPKLVNFDFILSDLLKANVKAFIRSRNLNPFSKPLKHHPSIVY